MGAVAARAAAEAGKRASYGAIYGAEVRGGLTAAQVVVDEEEVDFPFVERPHLAFAFDQRSYEAHVKPNPPSRYLVVDGDYVDPEPGEFQLLRLPATYRVDQELGTPAVANMMVLGFVARLMGLFDPEAFERALRTEVSAKFFQLDMRAFWMGYEFEP